jgi:hypothetical protein
VRPGFVEGGGGGGAGAGGFCASAGGTRSPMASASRTKMRGHECIGLSQGENVPAANLVGESVQVKVNNVYKSETTRLLPRAILAARLALKKPGVILMQPSLCVRGRGCSRCSSE